MADEATTTAAETSGDGSTTETDAATSATEQPQTTEGESALGDAGKKALDAMKAERNKARDELRSLRAEFEEIKAKAEGKESEHRAAQEAQRLKDELLGAANERILKAEVRAAAAKKLADPADALRFLDLSEFEVNDDGEADPSQIANAIDDLIKTKPYLAAQGGRFQGSADGGARNGTPQPAQLTQADIARMTPEQVDAAEKAGQFDALLGRT